MRVCVCVCAKEKKERERERETHTHTHCAVSDAMRYHEVELLTIVYDLAVETLNKMTCIAAHVQDADQYTDVHPQ